MGCVTLRNFVVIINGDPSNLFKDSRGLRQGCPLSHFLFFLIVEGLSKLIHRAWLEGAIKEVLVASLVLLMCLLFVDYVLLFGEGSQS